MRAMAMASPPLFPGPAKTTNGFSFEILYINQLTICNEARSIKSISAIGSFLMVYLSISAIWLVVKIFIV